MVVDVAPGTRYALSRTGDTVAIRFPDGTLLARPPAVPRNVRAMTAGAMRLDLTVASGATLRETRIDGRIVIDVLDPVARQTPAAPKPVSRPEPKPASLVPEPVMAPRLPLPLTPAPATALVPPVVAEPAVAGPPSVPGPLALAAAPVIPPGGGAFTVPFGAQAGAAVFRRGGALYVVFDERRPLDLSALRGDPVLGTAVVQALQAGTLIVLHPPAEAGVSLDRVRDGWKIAILPERKPPRPIPFSPKDGRLDLPAEAPGSVLSMADPLSGGTLLIGTLRRPGQATAVARRTAEFALLPAMMGVVLEPLADSVAMRTVPAGFVVTGGPAGLAMTSPTAATEAASAAVHLTRRFKLPAQSVDTLNETLHRGVAAAAGTPTRARGPKRRAVAGTMLSLGLGAEAEAVLLIAAEQDPKEAASPDTIGMTAVAALLAGRPGDAAGIEDSRLSGTDEIGLWRGIRQAMADETSPQAAAAFAASGTLGLLYPTGIRDRVLPLIAETMLLGGEPAAAKRLLALAGDAPGLKFARALVKQADGDAPGALAALDALAAGHDQRDRARAATRAVELRLAAGQLTAAQAADALDRLRYAWRGDRRELALRERIADLRQRAGNWRAALADLRSAQADFPDRAQAVQTHLMGTFLTLLYSEATDSLPPLDLVALVGENADLFKAMPDNEDLQARLADRLTALDLPSRAEPLLAKLSASASTPLARATFGTSLASMRLQEGDALGALAALTDSDGPTTDAALAERRSLLAAAAKSRLGDPAGAIAALAGISGLAVEMARATVYEQAGNWPAAEEALVVAVGATIPASGILNDPQRQLVLRLASAAERSGDRNGLAALRATLDSRLGSGPLADTIRLLTAEPLNGAADLPRAEKEMGLARALPAGLAALRGR